MKNWAVGDHDNGSTFSEPKWSEGTDKAWSEADIRLLIARAPQLRMDEQEALLRFFSTMEGSTFNFQLNRSVETQPDRSFSAEGLERLLDVVRLFVGGQILGVWRTTGRAPHHLECTITLDLK